MPTYDYLCPRGHEFERFQRITDARRVRCPTCGKLASRKISGGAGLIFKGSGFYITDYGKDGKGQPKNPEADSKPTSESKTEKTPPAEKAPAPEKKPTLRKPSGD